MSIFVDLFKKTEDWKGWRFACYLEIALTLIILFMITWDIVYVIINRGYPPSGFPIGSDCCGWSYKTVQNHTIYGVINLFFYSSSLVFLRKSSIKHIYKFILFLIFISLFWFIQILINPLP